MTGDRKLLLVLPLLFLSAAVPAAWADMPFQCTGAAGATPQLRAEGLTELVGDIFLTCVGGTALAPGAQIPTTTIAVSMNSTATSRLLGSGSGASEALLLIDDPQSATFSGVPYGLTLPPLFCGSGNALSGAGTGGCVEYVGNQGSVPATYGAFSGSNNYGVPVSGAANGSTPGANVFQGVVTGSTVTFYGVPILPPVTSGFTRTYRMTNIRINAHGISGGALTPATAQVATGVGIGDVPVPVTNSLLTVGYISSSLNTAITAPYSKSSSGLAAATTLQQCQFYPPSGNTPVALETLTFSELQGNAFKVRGSPSQTTPGQIFSGMESGMTIGAVTGSIPGGTATAGYSDWGTRVKAVFSNIPAGISLYVSTTNLNSNNNAPMGTVANAGSLTGSSFAQLITGETAPDTGPSVTLANNFTPWAPVVPQAGTATGSVTGVTAAGPIPYAPLTIVNGSATAVWEVANSILNNTDTLAFEVFIVQTSNPGAHIPLAPDTISVFMGYAPDPSQGAFTPSNGGSASNALGLPRFFDTSATPQTAAVTVVCNPTPALSPWALGVLAVLLLAMGVLVTRKRYLES